MKRSRDVRGWVRASVLCVALSAALGAESASAAIEPARPADAFVGTVGVNTHLHAQGTVYDSGFDSIIKPRLLASRIRHVRDGAATHAMAGPDFFYYRRCRELAEAGIRFNLTTTFRTAHQDPTDFDKLPGVQRWCGNAVESFEAVNEPDLQPMPPGADWVSETRALQEALYKTVRSRPALSGVAVLGPTAAWSPHAVGDLSAHLDYGNWHPYPGGECPTCGDAYGQNVDTYLPMYSAPSGAKPMVMTETGYHNAVNAPQGGHRPASELAAGKYAPRLLLEYFNRAFVRTYFYELIDAAPDPARQHPDANFGLLRHDGSPKPAYRAVKSLLDLLRDPGPAFTPRALDFTLGGQLDQVHHTLLQKRDGRFFLALWQERSSYDTGARPNAPDDVAARRDLVVPEQPVTISLAESPVAARIHRLDPSGALVSEPATATGGSLAVAVRDSVTVVELDMGRAADPVTGRRRPLLSRVRLTRRILRRGQGTRLRYRLARRATVSVIVVRKGRRQALRRLQAHRRAGARSMRIAGRVRGRPLRAGRYQVRVRARDAQGARSAVRVAAFKVLARRGTN